MSFGGKEIVSNFICHDDTEPLLREYIKLAIHIGARCARNPSDADELVSEALLALTKQVQKVQDGRLTPERFRDTIASAMRRACHMHIRREVHGQCKDPPKKVMGTHAITDRRRVLSQTYDPYKDRERLDSPSHTADLGYASETEILDALDHAIKTGRQREIFSLRRAGYSVREIAAKLGCSYRDITRDVRAVQLRVREILYVPEDAPV